MIAGKKVVVVMPAYNAENTIEKTWQEVMETQVVDLVIVVDDHSPDGTVARAKALPNVIVHEHPKNMGYGGNQKTCYRLAVDHGADIVIMVHPDYQYTPKLIPAMAGMVASGLYPCVLASRILGGGAIKGRMPWWRYVANRALTAADNILLGSKLSEFHTGYRAFSRELLTRLPLDANSDDFVFDNQILAQAVAAGLRIGEISCPASYHEDASSIDFARSVRYGLGVLATSFAFVAWRWRLANPRIFQRRPDDRLRAA